MVEKVSPPVDITPSGTTGWQTESVTSHVEDGNTEGILIHCHVNGSESTTGAREAGSTDSYEGDVGFDGGIPWYSGVNSSEEVDLYRASSGVSYYLIGYDPQDNATYHTNPKSNHEYSPSTGSWTDLDLSSTIGSQITLTYWVIDGSASSSNRVFGLRPNGSTDDRTEEIWDGHCRGAFMFTDGNGILEVYASNTDLGWYLVGYETGDGWVTANGNDYSTSTTDSYVDEDISSESTGTDVMAFVQQYVSDTSISSGQRDHHLRENGVSHDESADSRVNYHNYNAVPVDSDEIFEQWADNTALDLYLYGGGQVTTTDQVGSVRETSSGVVQTDSSAVVKTDP